MMRASSHAIKAIYVTSTRLKLLRSYIYFNVFQFRLRCKQVMADKESDLGEKYKAVMVLSGVGDALGYKNGSWEFCHSGIEIHKELKQLGGLEKLDINGWRVSDDTVLHIATGEALVSNWSTTEQLFCTMAAKYKKACAEVGITVNQNESLLKRLQNQKQNIAINIDRRLTAIFLSQNDNLKMHVNPLSCNAP